MTANTTLANAFLPTSQTFSQDYGQYLIQITKRDSDISRAINQREVASYQQFEILTGQLWPEPTDPQSGRNGFRKVFFASAPLGAVASIPHGFTDAELATFTWTYIGGTYTNKAAVLCGASIATEIDVNKSPGSNITFGVPAAFQVTYSAIVVLEYLKN